MPQYLVSYRILETETITRVSHAERIISAESLADAVTIAEACSEVASCFVVTTDPPQVETEAQILLDSVQVSSVSAPVVPDPGLPPAVYDPEPAPDGSDYNFIQVEPTPSAG